MSEVHFAYQRRKACSKHTHINEAYTYLPAEGTRPSALSTAKPHKRARGYSHVPNSQHQIHGFTKQQSRTMPVSGYLTCVSQPLYKAHMSHSHYQKLTCHTATSKIVSHSHYQNCVTQPLSKLCHTATTKIVSHSHY
jgi:hypothetical protein